MSPPSDGYCVFPVPVLRFETDAVVHLCLAAVDCFVAVVISGLHFDSTFQNSESWGTPQPNVFCLFSSDHTIEFKRCQRASGYILRSRVGPVDRDRFGAMGMPSTFNLRTKKWKRKVDSE